MTEPTKPDGIVKWQLTDEPSISQMGAQFSDSAQAALLKRQRFDFVWADSAARTAQTGMVHGSRGYQMDTRTDYLYETSAWMVATAHMEYTSGPASIAAGAPTSLGALTLDAGASNSTTMTSTSIFPTTGQVIFTNPGMYSYSLFLDAAAGFTGRTFIEVTGGAGPTLLARINIVNAGEQEGTLSIPGLYADTAAYPTFAYLYHTNAGAVTVSSRIRVTRLA